MKLNGMTSARLTMLSLLTSCSVTVVQSFQNTSIAPHSLLHSILDTQIVNSHSFSALTGTSPCFDLIVNRLLDSNNQSFAAIHDIARIRFMPNPSKGDVRSCSAKARIMVCSMLRIVQGRMLVKAHPPKSIQMRGLNQITVKKSAHHLSLNPSHGPTGTNPTRTRSMSLHEKKCSNGASHSSPKLQTCLISESTL
jgi:hypothetical protein